MKSSTSSASRWSDEIRVLTVRSMRGGPMSESDPFVATIEVRDDAGTWHRLEVQDEGTGGSYATQRPYKRGQNVNVWEGVGELEKRIERLHREQVPNDPADQFADVAHDWEVIVGDLVNEFEVKKGIQKHAETRTYFRHKGQIAWMTCAPTEASVAAVRSKYPGAEILSRVLDPNESAAAERAKHEKWVRDKIRRGYVVGTMPDGRGLYFKCPVTAANIAAIKAKHAGIVIENHAAPAPYVPVKPVRCPLNQRYDREYDPTTNTYRCETCGVRGQPVTLVNEHDCGGIYNCEACAKITARVRR